MNVPRGPSRGRGRRSADGHAVPTPSQRSGYGAAAGCADVGGMRALLLLGVVVALVLPGDVAVEARGVSGGRPRPLRVSLAAQQTPVRNQGVRGTCSAFAAVAGLEAAHKRNGHGDLDLSEEFVAYAGKLMWVDVQWTRVVQRGTDRPENFLAAATGSTGTFLVEMLGSGFATPTERDLPYRESYAGTLGGHERLDDPWWSVAWNVDLWNLDPVRLPRAALRAHAWHRVTDYRWIYLGRRESDATYAERFEEVLASGREIVWDVAVRTGAAADREPIWRFDLARPPNEVHAMLVVGYDRSDPDPRRHHFLVKNSWGRTAHPDGLTRVSYDFLRYGLGALYIEDVAPPSPWPAAAFVGRWHVSFDGRPAVLAWNRVPGVLQRGLEQARALHPGEPAMTDRRVGNLYPWSTPRPVYRVNGSVHDGRDGSRVATLWFDHEAPALRYDALPAATTGRRVTLRLVGPQGDAFVGTYVGDDGLPARCYGHLDGRLGQDGTAAPAAALTGTWRLWLGDAAGRLELHDGPRGPGTARLVVEALGLSRAVHAHPAADDPRVLVVVTDRPTGGALSLRLSPLRHEVGVLVGEAYVTDPSGGPPVEHAVLAARTD